MRAQCCWLARCEKQSMAQRSKRKQRKADSHDNTRTKTAKAAEEKAENDVFYH